LFDYKSRFVFSLYFHVSELNSPMKIINCTKEYAEPILDILNEAIVNSTALYDYSPRGLDSMNAWFDSKIRSQFPVIGLVDEQNQLLAFGSYGTFRSWPAYKYTVEHSLYVHKDHRGKGYGKLILREIVNDAKRKQYHNLIAGIDSLNHSSKKLHEGFGFKFCGRIVHAGYKFSTWLDLDFYQLLLPTPVHPADG
jgi:L-amino acid N-acyltransferase YncA